MLGLRGQKRSTFSLHLKDVRAKVEKIHPEMIHVDTVVKLSIELFDKLKRIPKLRSPNGSPTSRQRPTYMTSEK